MTDPCDLCPFAGCAACQHQGDTDTERPRKED